MKKIIYSTFVLIILISLILFTDYYRSPDYPLSLEDKSLYFLFASEYKGPTEVVFIEESTNGQISTIKDNKYIGLTMLRKESNGLTALDYNEKNEVYSVVNYSNKEWKSLLEVDTPIYHPQLVDNNFVFYYQVRNNKLELVRYSLLNMQYETILSESFDLESQFFVTNNGEILFTKSSDEEWYICIYNGEEVEILTKGRFSNWLHENETIVYYFDNKILKYNRKNKSSQIIHEDTYVIDTISVDENREYLAFIEINRIDSMMHEWSEFLSVIEIKKQTKHRVKAWNSNRILESGIVWSEDRF